MGIFDDIELESMFDGVEFEIIVCFRSKVCFDL